MPASTRPAPARARAGPAPTENLDVLVGEVRTTLLQNSHQVGADTVARLLDLDPGRRVLRATRPFTHAVSPDEQVGVHCPLPTGSGTRADGVGTVLARASVTGGIILQASAWARLVRAAGERRLPWSHYLTNPGTIEVGARCGASDLTTGFLRDSARSSPAVGPAREYLDLGAVVNRLLNQVQRMPYIDRVTMLRARRTRLRFAVTWRSPDSGELAESPDIELVVHDETSRTLRLRLPASISDPAEAVVACEDLALHDWLLTTVANLMENSRIGVDPAAEVVARIRPAVDHLLHLWMPGARVAEDLGWMWAALERRPGFSRQWTSLRGQIQNQLLLAVLEKPAAAPAHGNLVFQDGVEGLSHRA
ncbi:SCO2521 family protein [Parafrankia elaeagni]|uniref:SCO2521 family protein n=1 Tax=Parafrankia elaeagni TaxID=222534 RepID=UPI000367A91C|nr:SCO2521 family protein [Parafrankia elaeagni]